MSEGLLAAAEAFRAALARFEPELCSGTDCARVVAALSATENVCAATRARAAARAASTGAHRAAGYREAEAWLAQVSGTSTGVARATLDTAAALPSCPATTAALSAGELSLAQAAEIVRAEAAAPGAEAELLSVARGSSFAQLRDRARDRRLSTVAPEELHRRQRAARTFTHWGTALGNIGFSGELPPGVGVPFVNRIDAEAGRLRRAARRDGSTEPFSAHSADALAALVTGASSSGRARADVVIVSDLTAWRRGHVHPGEACHVIGGGSIPVSVAKELSSDAFLKAVIHDGVEISTVAHFGRHIPAHLRTALELGAPPDFQGVTCSEPGCERRYGLEWDHVNPVANGGPTSYRNLKPRCYGDHRDKTERDRLAGLLAPRSHDPVAPDPVAPDPGAPEPEDPP